MTGLAVKRAAVYWLVNHLFAGTRCFEVKRKLLNSIGHSLGNGAKVVGPIFCTGTLITGKDCWIGRNISIHGNGTVILGDRCDLAPEVTFLTGSHAIGTEERRAGPGKTDRIQIGAGCWIGAGATFLNEIRIGQGSVIAACACVVKDIPSNTLAGGVPARVVKNL